MTMPPPKPRRRSISAAAKPGCTAADDDDLVGRVRRISAGRAVWPSRFSLTKIRPSRCSTFQHSTGLKAGARTASPLRRSKQAWCQGHRTLSPTHEAVAERPVVVGAMGADRKQLRAAAHQQHLLVADVSDQLAVDEIGEGYALRQIGPLGAACSCAIVVSLGVRPSC